MQAIRSVTANAPLIGCTDAGGISTAGTRRRSVTVIGLIARNGSFVTSVERHLSQAPRQVGEKLADSLLKQLSAKQPPKALLVFPDGVTSNGSEFLSGLEKKLNKDLPIVGGSAADDFFFEKTFQFYNDEVLTDSVPGVMFCGDIRVGIGVRHGWMPLGKTAGWSRRRPVT